MKKTFNVVMLPTEKASKLCISKRTNILYYNPKEGIDKELPNQHLYIISDDEIKAGDWVLTGFPKQTSQVGTGFSDAKNANGDFIASNQYEDYERDNSETNAVCLN